MSLSNLMVVDLKSITTRLLITENDNGLRIFDLDKPPEPPPSPEPPNANQMQANAVAFAVPAILPFIGKFLVKGWVIRIASVILSGTFFTALVGFFIQVKNIIWNFDWNQTDEQIDNYLNQMKNMLTTRIGGILGNAVGFVACGGIPTAIMAFFNKPLALYVLKEVGEEAFEELIANLRLFVDSVFKYGALNFLFNAFKSARRFIKRQFKDPNNWLVLIVQRLFGSNFTRFIDSWGEPGSKPWSFSRQFDEFIESIKPDWLQNAVEEFFDEFNDACEEALYVVAGGLDSYILENRLQKDIILGNDAVVVVEPNREVPEEKIILAGKEELVKNQIVQALGVTYPIMDNRDVGQWVGEPMREEITRLPPISIQMRIILNEKEQPPFTKRVRIEGKDVIKPSKRTRITIPNIDRSKLDWEKIKLAVGGKNGYMWGRFLGKARLNDGSNLYVQAATSEEAQDRIEALLEFTKNELISLNVLEILKEGKRKEYESLYPEPIRIYPIAFTIINQQKVINEESGIAQLSGAYKRKKDLIPLNVDEKPDDFEARIQELFRIPGTNSTP